MPERLLEAAGRADLRIAVGVQPVLHWQHISNGFDEVEGVEGGAAPGCAAAAAVGA